jgi:hypothetical protein
VNVHVFEDAGAGRFAEIHPDIDAVRSVRLDERLLAQRLQICYLVPLLGRQRAE